MGTFVITRIPNGEFLFNLKSSNGEIILTSERYTSKAGCEAGVASVKSNAADDGRYERKDSSDGHPFFVLKAANNKVIGVSQLYADRSGRDRGIESTKQIAPDAGIYDETD